MEKEIKYIIQINEENINKLLEKGYKPYYSRQTGEVEGFEFKKDNILGADCTIDFKFDEDGKKLVLNDLTTIYGRKESNMIIANALLDLVFDSILEQEIIEDSKEPLPEPEPEPDIPSEEGESNG